MPANGSSVTKLDNVDECLMNFHSWVLPSLLSRNSKSSMLALTVKVKLKMTSSNAQNVVQHSYCLVARPFNQMAKLDLEGPDTTVVVYNDLIKAIVEQDSKLLLPS